MDLSLPVAVNGDHDQWRVRAFQMRNQRGEQPWHIPAVNRKTHNRRIVPAETQFPGSALQEAHVALMPRQRDIVLGPA